jgi:NADP-dependent 3-hydroxy acid dehydrogenase YdfG
MPEQAVAIVTGAGTGIGRAIAESLSRAGYAVTLLGRTKTTLDEVAAALDGPSLVIPTDVSDHAAVTRAIAQTTERFGRIDVLVNNAGLASAIGIGETTPDQLHEHFAINAFGPAYAICACWPHMAAQQSGCIINISTFGTVDPFPGFFAYAGSKASVNLFAKSIRNEGKRLGIRGFAVAPGAVETQMLRGIFSTEQLPEDQALQPQDIADVVMACVLGEHDDRNGETIVAAK